MTISAIVPAAGCGARAALNGNKILAPLHRELSVLYWTLNALHSGDYKDLELLEIIVVARAGEFEVIEEVKQQCAFDINFKIVEGGATRQDSVQAGVESARGDFVLVHDAARPCVSSAVIGRTIADAQARALPLQPYPFLTPSNVPIVLGLSLKLWIAVRFGWPRLHKFFAGIFSFQHFKMHVKKGSKAPIALR
jgi:CTP:molybdopterin cytidylyltransferase MocA